MATRGSPHRLVLGGAAAAAVLVVAAAVFPATVYDGVIWKHFVGPIIADAANQASVTLHGVKAHRGYTPFSIAVYAVLLLYGVGLVRRLFDRFDVDLTEDLVVSFVPFMVAGGLLRVVEDAGLASYPWNTLLISPVIYLLLAVAGGVLIAAGRYAKGRGRVASMHRFVAAAGSTAAAVLVVLLFTTVGIGRSAGELQLLLGVAAGAVVLGLAGQYAAARRYPDTFLATRAGAAAVAAQVLDGAVTAVIVSSLGGQEKLPLSGVIIEAVHPAAFPAVKLGVTLLFLGAAQQGEADRMTALMLLVLIAVGLGPGVRNLARAVFGV